MRAFFALTTAIVVVSALIQGQSTAHDPGVRGGGPGAGGPISGLSPADLDGFNRGKLVFERETSVQGTVPGTALGLGPRFNSDSCVSCHSQPAAGGTSPTANPLFGIAMKEGGSSTVPAFITSNGPVREARFKYNPSGSRDGSVHNLFTVSGRSDAPGCVILQPDFAGAASSNNLSLRIPTSLFGLGLLEAIQDTDIFANAAANASRKKALGIAGMAHLSPNDATVMRFGWKAQNKSLLLFAGEASNVELGRSNELFTQERAETQVCLFNTVPEVQTDLNTSNPTAVPSDIERLAMFMRFSAPPAPAPDTSSIVNGRALFSSIGCALCHTPSFTTSSRAANPALRSKSVNLYSDLLLHDMGSGLEDDIVQGNAGPTVFRTAPLMGLGQRVFFLHDGRANDLLQAIAAHSSNKSEANQVIASFNSLTQSQQQDVLNFLRAL